LLGELDAAGILMEVETKVALWAANMEKRRVGCEWLRKVMQNKQF
jgi:hypothetical protein